MTLSAIFEKKGPIRRIGVLGMGYVGIPSAALFAASPSFDFVYGFQRDTPSSGYKIALLNRGVSPMKGDEPGLSELLLSVVQAGKFSCTSDFSFLAGLDAITIAIQTPFLDNNDLLPDFSALKEGITHIGSNMTRGTLVVLESTVTPGSTEGFAREILEQESGLVAGVDFGLAHAPERVMAGRLIRNIQEHDRVIGGIDEASTRRAAALYTPVMTTGTVIPMTARAAEVTKTAENTLRDLQIAAVNELALYCEAMGINFYDVRAGIDSLRGEGITRAMLWPGAGVGGHCLTKDTYHLERGVQVLGKGALDYPKGERSLYMLARTINDFMPRHMVTLVKEGLARIGKGVQGSRIALLGWAFLANSDDARNTPSEVCYNLLKDMGAEVLVHDPLVTRDPAVSIMQDLGGVLHGADAILIFTGHTQYRSLDPGQVKALSGKSHPVIVDGRNLADPEAFIKKGFVYKGIGRGDKNNHPIF